MVVTKYIQFQTDPRANGKQMCIIDITPQVEQQLAEADMNSGIVTLFLSGSTAGISTIMFPCRVNKITRVIRRAIIETVRNGGISFDSNHAAPLRLIA